MGGRHQEIHIAWRDSACGTDCLVLCPLSKVFLAEVGYEPIKRNPKRFANPEQRENRGWPARLNHLPMAHAEAVREHVLLAELAFLPVGTDTIAQCTEKPPVLGW